MKKRAYIYAGETVVLRFEAHTEGKVLDLSGYDVEIDIATTAMGHHIVKCSAENSVDVSQAARGMLLCPLSAEDTGSLTPGTATIGVRLLHDKFVRMGFDASIEVLRQGATPSAVLSRTAQPVVTLHTPCIWVNMDFAATRGDDGKTPYVGENGNWFIGDEDTGERALGVTYDDLTPEQIAELQRPATEAAAEANDAAQAAATATKEAKAATEGAKSASDRAERMAEEARNEAAAAASAAEAAATATEEADAAAVTANAAAQAANTAAEGIDEKIAGKADLDPATGCVPSAQIAPLQGKQTGVQMGSGCFVSDDARLLIDGNKTLSVIFIHKEYIKDAIHLLFSDHDYSTLSKGIYLFTIDNFVYMTFCGKHLLSEKIEAGAVYQVVVSVDMQGEAVGYINSLSRNHASDFATYTVPVGFSLGGLKTRELKYTGLILGARLFNYALSASEVAALWNDGQPQNFMLPPTGVMREGVVAEYVPSGLLTDKWRDTSGNGLDLPYLPTSAGGTAQLMYDYAPSINPAQLNPLWGRQTGVQMGSGTFSSTAASLLIKGDVSIEAVFTLYPNSSSAVIYTEGFNSKLRTRLYVTADNRIVASYKGGPTNELYAQLNTQYHIVLTKDSLFVNGVRVKSVTPGDGDPVMLMLGSQYISESTPSNIFFNGIINSVRLFNYALSASEVATLWNGGQPERYMLPRNMFHPDETIFPTEKYTPSKNTWKIGVPADGTAAEDVAAANGFSGPFQRITSVNNATLNIYSDFLNSSTAIRAEPKIFQVEYRSSVPIRVMSNNMELLRLDANEGEAKRVSFISAKDKLVYLYPTTAGGYVEIRTLSIAPIQCVAEYVPAGLLTDRWRDTSGAGLDLPYLSKVAGQPAELDYQQPPATPSGSPLHDLFVAAGAVWDDATHSWTVADYTGIDNKSLTNIYDQSHNLFNGTDWTTNLLYATIPVNLPPRVDITPYRGHVIVGNSAFAGSSIQHAVIAVNDNANAGLVDIVNMFRSCTKLTRIVGIISLADTANLNSDVFLYCSKLERVRIRNLKKNISFQYSPLLSLESLQYLVQNATNTTAIIVTVHADVYAKLTDPTNTEWYAINAAAQAKNISFATA